LRPDLVFDNFLQLWPHDIDRGGVKVRLDVRRVIIFDHLDAGAVTGIINCQIRKENPSQTLSDAAVDFYDVRPAEREPLTIIAKIAKIAWT